MDFLSFPFGKRIFVFSPVIDRRSYDSRECTYFFLESYVRGQLAREKSLDRQGERTILDLLCTVASGRTVDFFVTITEADSSIFRTQEVGAPKRFYALHSGTAAGGSANSESDR